jgi:hypothetical protein
MRKGLTPDGRERLRAAALANRPWLHSSGPKTTEGKRASAANGKARQRGPVSVRELRAELAGFNAVLSMMRAGRRVAAGAIGAGPIGMLAGMAGEEEGDG